MQLILLINLQNVPMLEYVTVRLVAASVFQGLLEMHVNEVSSQLY